MRRRRDLPTPAVDLLIEGAAAYAVRRIRFLGFTSDDTGVVAAAARMRARLDEIDPGMPATARLDLAVGIAIEEGFAGAAALATREVERWQRTEGRPWDDRAAMTTTTGAI